MPACNPRFLFIYLFSVTLLAPEIHLSATKEAVYYFVNLDLMLTSLESNAGLMSPVKDKGENE